MATVGRWTGRDTRALRQALRLTVRHFAEDLGVSPRTVSKWESGGSKHQPRPELQRALDTMLARAGEDDRQRFLDAIAPTRELPQTADRKEPRPPASDWIRSLPLGPLPGLPRMTIGPLRQLTEMVDRPASSPARLFGVELRLARDQAGLSLAGLADEYRAVGQLVHPGYLANVESGERLPSDRKFAEIADDLLVTGGLLARLWDFADAARLSTCDQAHQARSVVTELATADAIASDILSGDPRRVASEQTSHALDLTIAALIAADGPRSNPLVTWITDAPDPVLRVNAAGIAAKMPGSDTAESAVTALATDPSMRHRYLTAVVSRVLRTPWSKAREHAADPRPGQHVTAACVDLLGTELRNEHDAGARWCTAYLLADIWATPEHPGNVSAANALEAALADESLPKLRTVYGRALARRALVS